MSNLIFDRTLSDIINRTEKGFYNASDMQRVDLFTKKLTQKLKNEGHIIDTNTKDSYVIGYFPKKLEDFERIRQNIIELRKIYNGFIDTPATPFTLNFLDYIKANNIEKILNDIEIELGMAIESYRYCGTFDCGTDFQL